MEEKDILKLYRINGYFNEVNSVMYIVAYDFSEAEKLDLDYFDGINSINLIATSGWDNDEEVPLIITEKNYTEK